MTAIRIFLKIVIAGVIFLCFGLDKTWYAFVFLVIAVCSLSFGLFLYHFPLKAFDIQKKFYALINWKIEPISLAKEIRNTKIMGLFVILFALAATFYFLWQ